MDAPTTSAKAAQVHDYKRLYEAQVAENQKIQKERKVMEMRLATKAPGAPAQERLANARDADSGKSAMVVDEPGNVAASLEAAAASARDELRQMESFSELNQSFIIDFPGKLAAAKAKLDAANANRRAANPLKQRLEGAEAHQQKTAKKLSCAKAAMAAKQKELVSLQEAIAVQAAAVDAAAAVLAKADTEVAELASQFAAERSAGVDVSAESQAPAQGQGPTLPDPNWMAFVEEKWAEREAEFARHIAQLGSLVADVGSNAPPSEIATTDVADMGSLEGILVEDDASWSTVEKGKRKALIRLQRDKLAKEVRHSLSKVSAGASPFKKK